MAYRLATDLDVQYNQYGPRPEQHRRKVSPAVQVERAAWSAAGRVDYWVKDGGQWYGRLIDDAGRAEW